MNNAIVSKIIIHDVICKYLYIVHTTSGSLEAERDDLILSFNSGLIRSLMLCVWM